MSLGLSSAPSSSVLLVCALCVVTCDSGLSAEFTEVLHRVICPNSSLSEILKTSSLSQDCFPVCHQKAGAFPLLTCFCTWACIWARWTEGRERDPREFSHLPGPQRRISSLRALWVALYMDARRSWEGRGGLGLVWCDFKSWSSSSVHLLLWALCRPQVAAPCRPPRICICSEWERQGEVRSFHYTQNQNLITHSACIIVGKET